MVQAISGLMSLTGDPDGPPYRAGISVFDVMAGNHAAIGILAALRHRDAHRRGPARRGQPAVLGADRAGQPQLGLRRRRRGAVPDGQRAPERVPLRAAAHRRRRPDRRRGQRRPVPQAVRGARHPRGGRRPAVRAQRRPHRQPRGAAPAAGRAAGAPAARWSGSTLLVAAGVPCGPINTIDGGFAMAERFGLDPVVAGRRGRPGGAHHPQPDPLLRDARRATGCRRPSWTSTAPSCAPGSSTPRRTTVTDLDVPDRARRVRRRTTITLLGQDLAEDVMGKVGFGELAFWLATQRRPTPGEARVFEAVLAALADHGFTPTAIATRLTYLSAPDSVQGALAAGLLGGGSRFLGVTEDCGRFLHDVLAARRRRAADRRRRLGRARPARPCGAAGGRAVRPRARPPRAQGRRPAHPAADADRRARRACSARTWRCSRRSAGCTRRCSAARCRSTAPGSAAPRSPTSACRWSCCAGSRCWPAPPG